MEKESQPCSTHLARSINGYTCYPSAFLVFTTDGVYSKHYYAGTQHIVSLLGDQSAEIFNNGQNCETCKQESKDFEAKKLQQAQKADLQLYADHLKKGTILYKDYKAIPIVEQEKALQDNEAKKIPGNGDPNFAEIKII